MKQQQLLYICLPRKSLNHQNQISGISGKGLGSPDRSQRAAVISTGDGSPPAHLRASHPAGGGQQHPEGLGRVGAQRDGDSLSSTAERNAALIAEGRRRGNPISRHYPGRAVGKPTRSRVDSSGRSKAAHEGMQTRGAGRLPPRCCRRSGSSHRLQRERGGAGSRR